MPRRRTSRGESGITMRGGAWWVRVTVGGHLFSGTFPSLELARIAHDKWRLDARLRQAQVQAGVLAQSPAPERPVICLAELCARFLLHKQKRVRPATLEFYRRELQLLLRYSGWGRMLLTDLSPARIQAYLDDRLAKVSSTTVAIHYRALRALLRQAVQLEMIERNPLDKVDRIRQEEKVPRRLTGPQIQSLLKALSDYHPTYRAFFTTLVFTGLRRSEILAMEWDWVDLEGGILTVRRSKTGKLRHIDLAAPVLDALGALPHREGPVWISPKTRRPLNGPPYNVLRLLLRRAGLPLVGFHAFRHSFCTEALEAGVPLDVVQDLAGHSDPRITRRYARTLDGRKRQGIRQLEAHIDSLAKVVPLPVRSS